MKIYELADDSVHDLLKEAISAYHNMIGKLEIKFGLIRVTSVDKKGEPDEKPALKSSSGHAAAAQISLVSKKDQLSKNYEVEILFDGPMWDGMTDKKRLAILDHELTHIEIAKDKDGHAKIDDLTGKPKLKLIPDQFHLWGFLDIAKRHGEDSSEVANMRSMAINHGHLFGLETGTPPAPKDELAPDSSSDS